VIGLGCVKMFDLQKKERRQSSNGKIDSYGPAKPRALNRF